MLDSGCDTHLLSSGLSDKLGLGGVPEKTIMQTADGRRREIATEVVNLQVCSVDGQDFYSLKGALVVDCLLDVSSSIPFSNEFSCHDHLRDLEFPEVDKKEVVLIIGICSPELHDLCDMRRDSKGEP